MAFSVDCCVASDKKPSKYKYAAWANRIASLPFKAPPAEKNNSISHNAVLTQDRADVSTGSSLF